jgi:hypothetical protein
LAANLRHFLLNRILSMSYRRSRAHFWQKMGKKDTIKAVPSPSSLEAVRADPEYGGWSPD